MTNGNGHSHDAEGALLLELEQLHKRVRNMEARVHAIARNNTCTRCERVLGGASRGGRVRAEMYKNDARREMAMIKVEELAEQFPNLSFSRRCDLVARPFGVSASTIRRWVK